jgi:hypothetical protein
MLIMNYIIYLAVLPTKIPFQTNLNFIFVTQGYQNAESKKSINKCMG